ncbi:uncharacterized protein MONOS_3240 [Monocercomonoides exilis]|uniref:uncharacterized protein n=1 Tax=Monocercomonoides exilis TaxID=2049356 RepID=UPI00355AC753|nr:hypothetical protein MONOS_3240 [Monocercomonoides exilis]|eukprot:MONOS_3240.1-p1 / transcript=MONOS_3240.1 / gene=MONOS_3240 / organism=Monocercomonoides_exilis_PA203 / gene_product=unspecified product / transcript_product=unspecified product / location=Mono_scaffold00074:141849-143090(-) / protein_length=414 / sequence_SO=supercontig / SO=protein_coding / is_pseudo=false
MDKESFESIEHNIPQPIREFAARLSEDLKNKCMSLFSNSAQNLPIPSELDRFSESLSVLEKVNFWKAVSQVQDRSTNHVPLPSLPTSENICAYPAAPPNFDGTNNLMPVADEVSCDLSTDEGDAAPKNKWELSFVAPVIDEEGVPSREYFSQLMKGEVALEEPEKDTTPFLRSTDVQHEVARKSIENNTFLNDRCLDEDQKAVITEFKRIWEKEKKRVACNNRFYFADSIVALSFSAFLFVAGIPILIVGGDILEKSITRNAGIALIATGASFIICSLMLEICIHIPICINSFGEMRDLSHYKFTSELKGVMRPCVEQRIKDWRRKKELRWLLSKEERKTEEIIDKEEEERKKNKEKEKVDKATAIAMEKMIAKQMMLLSDGKTGNLKNDNSTRTVEYVEVGTEAIVKDDEYV